MQPDYRAHPILYVDDDVHVLSAFRLAFGEDLNVRTTSSPEEALQMIKNGLDVSVLLVDQRMPRLSGADLLTEVRKIRPELVRMMVTAYADMESVTDAVNKGQVSRFIVKPWRHEEMLAALHGAIDMFHLSRKVRDLQLELFKGSRQSVASVLLEELSHEMNNALSSLQFNLNFLDHGTRELVGQADQLGVGGDAKARMQELIDAVGDSIRSARHVQSVLQRTRSKEHGRDLRARFAPVDVRTLVETSLRMAVSESNGQIRTSIDVPPHLPELKSDATAMSQILLNLFLNAAQAMDAAKKGNSIRVEVVTTEKELQLRVSDTGCGIPPENLARIFEPRFTTKTDTGSGLGLAVSRDLARQLGGELSVVSEPGNGSTFTLSLPL